MSSIIVVPIYLEDKQGLVTHLTSCIQRTFHVPVRIRPVWFDPQRAFDALRGQYNSNELLRQLLSDPGPQSAKIIGVISRDLFSPALTYVFGEAQLSGRAATVSIERLRTEVYGLPSNARVLQERLEKEAIHELGHTYGLVHCRDGTCVMHPSTWAEQIDLKSAHFCMRCLTALAPQRP